ncbi:DUF3515 domain-containing protein [Mycobacterium sp. CVI_P3]|uniref:DUF3515 domain-containing protein n=1 Tax=Mycobacterium pinniadriaticum TaxID=2994102 RepID=A0ABT3SBI1_9MYCO|nr:DUF3515 domain-containing protein [Mycobacterium pinniadriaticum]MCX2930448.1 DUF3515 domain-containing protein [Mycobacterium pinniadriaticum]MCX2936872.1 DUF3515 domain-containing protein [Mycobacterium pinniadriaticum]
MPTEPAPAATEERTPDGPPRAVLIAAVVVAVVAIGAVLGIAATRRAPIRPVAIASAPAPEADSSACRALLDALPAALGEFQRVAAVDPVPPGAAAWRATADSDPVIMRCGIGRPAEFVVGSPIQMVDAVQWFRLDDPASDHSTWVTVDRPVYVALTLPTRSGPTPIQALSDLIARTMPAVPIDPNPAR